ncbi:putative zinc knuckle [Colletotrichum sublineola]|uniref:Putative zinc knuckle n=1 Tax=Colletotrichum sublineola TaxID=1173701 RepID=A0A066XVC9_COLSU|nr:putative zinc knuckle [Colletotrichum sublineola]
MRPQTALITIALIAMQAIGIAATQVTVLHRGERITWFEVLKGESKRVNIRGEHYTISVSHSGTPKRNKRERLSATGHACGSETAVQFESQCHAERQTYAATPLTGSLQHRAVSKFIPRSRIGSLLLRYSRCCMVARIWLLSLLPAVVWKQIWPVVRDWVLWIFRASLEEGTLPHQWRHAKIIPLKKPGKDNYTLAKAWRPISLLATLGKVLESLIAERISHVVESHGLLPTNHFGARKQRSAEQALLLLQEQVYTAWRGRRVLSLVSFDVKGAYNGVCKERLIQRMRARGMPEDLLRWVSAFCSDRTAAIQVNGQLSEVRSLPQAGLPQGSPLSPILFLFFNADLVQRRIDSNGGAVAFVDDFTAWVTGRTARDNREAIEAIISDALNWEKRSGATFEADKTAIIHFTHKDYKSDPKPYTIKGQVIHPTKHAKVLGVIIDTGLKYKEHIAKASSKGLKTALKLQRLRGLSPATARQLFTATVAPVVDYASNVWMHAYKDKLIGPINRVQRVAAKAIVGTFLTVATNVAEAEAHILTAKERFWRKAVKTWTDIHTLPETNPLRRITARMRRFKKHCSPLLQIAEVVREVPIEQLKTINLLTLLP